MVNEIWQNVSIPGKSLTTEEQSAFDEVEEKGIVEVLSRREPNYTEAEAERMKVFKSLCYKDLINFSYSKTGIAFISRKKLGKF